MYCPGMIASLSTASVASNRSIAHNTMSRTLEKNILMLMVADEEEDEINNGSSLD